MAEIMSQTRSLDDLGMYAHLICKVSLPSNNIFRQATADLCNLVSMLLPRVKDVQFAGPDDLRDSGQAVECRRIENAIAIPSEAVALIIDRDVVLAGPTVRG